MPKLHSINIIILQYTANIHYRNIFPDKVGVSVAGLYGRLVNFTLSSPYTNINIHLSFIIFSTLITGELENYIIKSNVSNHEN